MNKYELATGLVDLEELSMESVELDENGGATPLISFISGAVSSAVISALVPTTACSSKCK